jgi:hypothetical protein
MFAPSNIAFPDSSAVFISACVKVFIVPPPLVSLLVSTSLSATILISRVAATPILIRAMIGFVGALPANYDPTPPVFE